MTRPALLAVIVLAAGLGLLYAPALAGMQAMWDATPMYSFGYMVPFVSAYLIWMRRDVLAAQPTRPGILAGLAVAAAALGLLVAGRLASAQLAEQVSFLLALVAAVLLVWGAAVARTIWVALAYLLLMVPVWDGFTEPLHAPFQRLSARLGVGLLQLAGVPAFQEGLFIYLPNVTLEVARACSGVNYLIAVLALGIPLGYLWLPSMRRRVVLVGSAILIAALSNSLRVALIGALAYAEVGSPLHGPAHVLHGLFVSGIGFVVLLAGVRVLAPREAAGRPAPAPAPVARTGAPVPLWRPLIVAAACVAFWAALTAYRPVAAPLVRPLATLPPVLGEWRAVGSDSRSAAWWREADDALSRTYAAPDGSRVEVAIGYFAAQAQGHEVASHLSAPLHRATVGLASLDGAAPAVAQVRLPVPGGHRDGVFWYDVQGQVVTSAFGAKAATARSALTSRRTPGLLVVVLDADRSLDRASAGGPAMRFAAEVSRGLRPILGRPQ